MIQEAFGVNDHIDDVARRFAAEGYLAVAPHLFHRRGDPKVGYDDLPAAMAPVQQLQRDEILDDVDAALAELDRAGIAPERRVIVGFCMGGTVALLVAVRRPVAAAVTFYGGGVKKGRFGFGSLIDEARQLTAQWLGLFGDLDHGIPVEEVEELRLSAASSGQQTEVVRYADAGHGFHCDQRPSYHRASAEDAWGRTLAWFAAHAG